MELKKTNEFVIGTASAAGAYLLWGILPVYWKSINSVPSDQIIAHRVLWCFLFLVLVLIFAGRFRGFLHELRGVMARPKQVAGLCTASLLISINWYLYIWAVNDGRIVEASLGYYINPLVSVLLGIVFLKEKLSLWQMVSFLLAFVGVLNMAVSFGALPWVSLALAVTFGMYGLLKKIVSLDAISGLTIETMIIAPLALAYLAYAFKSGTLVFSFGFSHITILTMGAGVVTAAPLLLFAAGANRLPLYAVGFLQYLSPTISLLLGVFLYKESFTTVHLVSFSLIWAALIVFSLATTRSFIKPAATPKSRSFQ
ncbi:MAG: EamA family transporter RarD [Desulfotomaculaceae bacterium]|nr:EamA family transporter RarD [Desulfotomaculaceae bacterium]